jgi:hypothetical protein
MIILMIIPYDLTDELIIALIICPYPWPAIRLTISYICGLCGMHRHIWYNEAMLKNGRSTAMIRTNDPRRRQLWLRLFGVDQLPVLAGRPRWVCDVSGDREVYDLDLQRLRPGAVYRLAGYVARCKRRPYALVLSEIQTSGFWVDATDCVVEETAAGKRPFFLWATLPTTQGAAYA